ncbi:hypothetical protein QTN25_002911 [Entamoeba marina]
MQIIPEDSVQNQLKFLYNIFPSLPTSLIHNVWNSHNNSFDETIDALVTYLDVDNNNYSEVNVHLMDSNGKNSSIEYSKDNVNTQNVQNIVLNNVLKNTINNEQKNFKINSSNFLANNKNENKIPKLDRSNATTDIIINEKIIQPRVTHTENGLEIRTNLLLNPLQQIELEKSKYLNRDIVGSDVTVIREFESENQSVSQNKQEKVQNDSQKNNGNAEKTKVKHFSNRNLNLIQKHKTNNSKCFCVDPPDVKQKIMHSNHLNIPKMQNSQFPIIKPIVQEPSKLRFVEKILNYDTDEDIEDFATDDSLKLNFNDSFDKQYSNEEPKTKIDSDENSNGDCLNDTNNLLINKKLLNKTKSEGPCYENSSDSYSEQNITSSYVDFNSKSNNSIIDSDEEDYIRSILKETFELEETSSDDECKAEYCFKKTRSPLMGLVYNSTDAIDASEEEWIEYEFDVINNNTKICNEKLQQSISEVNKEHLNHNSSSDSITINSLSSESIFIDNISIDNKSDQQFDGDKEKISVASETEKNLKNQINHNSKQNDKKSFGSRIKFPQLYCHIRENDIQVKFGIPEQQLNENSWIGIYDKFEIDNSKYLSSEYTKNSNASIVTFTNLKQGKYTAKLFLNNKTSHYYDPSVTVDVCIGKEVVMEYSLKQKSNKKVITYKIKQ